MNEDSPSGQSPNHNTDVNDSWQPNKGLNILTGVNGSGKTRVLDYIYSFTNPIKKLFAEPIWTPREDEAKLKLKNELKLIPNDGWSESHIESNSNAIFTSSLANLL